MVEHETGTILVVDDNPGNCYFLEVLLKGNGYKVVCASNGSEAVELLNHQKFILIISDIMMPVMDGFQLCNYCRQQKSDLQDTPFVFYTATYTSDKDEEFAYSLGAHRFIRKPAEPGEFEREITSVLKNNKNDELKIEKPVQPEEKEVLKLYNERLVNKLEQKVLELEKTKSDLTKTKLELSQSEYRYRLLVENIPAGVAIVQNKQIVFSNKYDQNLTGYSADELNAIDGFNLVHPDDREMVTSALAKRTGSGDAPAHYIFRIIHKSGETRWIERHVVMVAWDGQPAVLVLDNDITERRQAEEKLIQSEQYTRSIIQLIPDIVVRVSKDGIYLDVIAGPEHKLVESSKYLVGKNIKEVFSPELSSRFYHALIASIEERKLEHIEYDLEVPQGRLWFEARIIPSANSEALILIRDITTTKQAELEREEFRAKAEASSRLAAIGEMAAGIAHEINNPLTGVIGFSELLAQEDLSPDVAQHVRYIIEGSNRVRDIVKRLLTFARQTRPFKTSVDIHGIIDNTLAMRSYVLETSNIEVVKDFDASLPWVTVDPGQIQQVFLNLIINAEHAIKRAHEGGRLIIATRKEGGEITISFQDNGTGMEGETLSRLFQPFFTTKEPGEGTGLGLALSHSIIQNHGGSIDVASKPGRGSTFTVRLPLLSDEPESKPETLAAEHPSGPAVAGNILVVDDEASVRAFVDKILQAQGHTVTMTDNPYQALREMESGSFDAIIIDMRMPGMSGKELYETLLGKNPEVAKRIIFITGDTSDHATQEFLKKEHLRCVSKPFTKEELTINVYKIIANKSDAPF